MLVERLQLLVHVCAHLGGVFDHSLAFHDFEVGETGGAGYRVTAESYQMAEGRVFAHEGVGDLLAGNCGTDGNVSARERLGDGEDVRLDAPMLGGEHLAGAPEAGDDLVANHDDAVLIAYLSDGGPILGMRYVDARCR